MNSCSSCANNNPGACEICTNGSLFCSHKPYHWATGGYGSHARAIIYREGQPIGELALGIAGEVVEKLNAPDPVSDRDAILELCKLLMWRARPQNGDRPHDDYLRAEYFLKKYS